MIVQWEGGQRQYVAVCCPACHPVPSPTDRGSLEDPLVLTCGLGKSPVNSAPPFVEAWVCHPLKAWWGGRPPVRGACLCLCVSEEQDARHQVVIQLFFIDSKVFAFFFFFWALQGALGCGWKRLFYAPHTTCYLSKF